MAELHQPHGDHDAASHHAVHHEYSDVNIAGVFGFGAALLITAILIHLLVFVMFQYFDTREAHGAAPQYPLAVAQGDRLPPEPRLQTNPRQDLAELRAREDNTLTTYGWVDRNAGIMRIPIDEAIKLTIERGLPARAEPKP